MYNHHTVKRYLHENLERSPRLQEVADAFNFTPETLRRKFRQFEKKPFPEFVNETKLAAMQEKLRTTKRCCYEIADDFKFSNDANAERWFKRKTGMTMMEFREKNGGRCGETNCLDELKRARAAEIRNQNRALQISNLKPET